MSTQRKSSEKKKPTSKPSPSRSVRNEKAESDWEPRPAIYPAEWLEENAPMPLKELETLRYEHLIYNYEPPYTVEEIKRMFPGLYFPVEH